MKCHHLLCIFLGLAGQAWSQGFTIRGTELLDQNGQPFVMKGVSIPMVELHNVTGLTDANRLNDMAKFWAGKKAFLTGANVAKHVLINIANEWGDWGMANTDAGRAKWRDAYKTAITTIRDAGIKTTLVIDSPDWGQDLKNGSTLLAHAKELQEHDPLHNLLFSVHMYCEWGTKGGSSIATGLPGIKAAGIPIIVGEFGYQHTEGSGICDITETEILSTAEENAIGWLAWSWKGNGSGVAFLDLSQDWGGNNLSAWGNTVVNGAHGTKTAKLASVFSGIIAVKHRSQVNAAPSAPVLTTEAPPGSDPGVDGRWILDGLSRKVRVILE